LICTAICLLGLVSFTLYSVVNNTILEDQKVSLYNYNNVATVDYQVNLKPNALYQNNTLGKDQVYLSEFIDSIKATFEYQFSGDRDIELQGEYDIVALVSGSARKSLDEGDIVIWEKSFPLLSKQTFTIKDNIHPIKKTISIKLDEYNEFAKLANEISKVSNNVNLQLVMNIKVNGTIEKETIEEYITPNIVIPLDTPMFEITTNNVDKPGAIEKTIQVQQPIDKNQVILNSIILGIIVLGLIFLIFFTKSAPKKSILEKELNKIFKKHGDRLVALSSNVDISNARYVRSIDDLVRLADEINKPILYKYSDDYKEINKFFITNDDEIYVFNLDDLLPKEEAAISEQVSVDSEK